MQELSVLFSPARTDSVHEPVHHRAQRLLTDHIDQLQSGTECEPQLYDALRLLIFLVFARGVVVLLLDRLQERHRTGRQRAAISLSRRLLTVAQQRNLAELRDCHGQPHLRDEIDEAVVVLRVGQRAQVQSASADDERSPRWLDLQDKATV